MKLPLVDCQYANSFIIVGLKGIDQAVKPPSKPLQNAGGADGLNESMVNLIEDLDRLKKEKRQIQREADDKAA